MLRALLFFVDLFPCTVRGRFSAAVYSENLTTVYAPASTTLPACGQHGIDCAVTFASAINSAEIGWKEKPTVCKNEQMRLEFS